MEDKFRKGKISRRSIFPLLGSVLLIPLLGVASNKENSAVNDEKDEEYQTLLKSDGSTVKVKVSTIKKSKIIQKNISNRSLLTWLGKKI